MVGRTTINFIILALGVIIGAYLPLALIYLVSFFRQQRFGFVLIKKAAVRLGVIIVLFFLIFVALGLTNLLFGPEGITDEGDAYLGGGIAGGFFVGIILFIIGLVRGRRRVETGSGA
jgi:hypothetical protein